MKDSSRHEMNNHDCQNDECTHQDFPSLALSRLIFEHQSVNEFVEEYGGCGEAQEEERDDGDDENHGDNYSSDCIRGNVTIANGGEDCHDEVKTGTLIQAPSTKVGEP